jgi:hypothetical protein
MKLPHTSGHLMWAPSRPDLGLFLSHTWACAPSGTENRHYGGCQACPSPLQQLVAHATTGTKSRHFRHPLLQGLIVPCYQYSSPPCVHGKALCLPGCHHSPCQNGHMGDTTHWLLCAVYLPGPLEYPSSYVAPKETVSFTRPWHALGSIPVAVAKEMMERLQYPIGIKVNTQ